MRERSVLRQMIAAGAEIANMGYQPQGGVFTELLDQAEQKVFQIAEQTNRGQGPKSMRSSAAAVLKEPDQLYHDPSASIGGDAVNKITVDKNTPLLPRPVGF